MDASLPPIWPFAPYPKLPHPFLYLNLALSRSLSLSLALSRSLSFSISFNLTASFFRSSR